MYSKSNWKKAPYTLFCITLQITNCRQFFFYICLRNIADDDEEYKEKSAFEEDLDLVSLWMAVTLQVVLKCGLRKAAYCIDVYGSFSTFYSIHNAYLSIYAYQTDR